MTFGAAVERDFLRQVKTAVIAHRSVVRDLHQSPFH